MKKTVYITFILFSLNLFVGLTCYGQLYVSEGTVVHLNGDLTTQERLNVINEDLTGSSSIVFKSIHEQSLSTRKGINLPGLEVVHSTLFITSSFNVKGNISLQSSKLYLTQNIFLGGKLLQDDTSRIYGHDYILKVNDLKPAPTPLTNAQVFKIHNTPALIAVDKAQTPFDLPADHILPYFIEVLKDSAFLSKISPPPKQSC